MWLLTILSLCAASIPVFCSHHQSYLPDSLLQEVMERMSLASEPEPMPAAGFALDFPDPSLEQALAFASVLPASPSNSRSTSGTKQVRGHHSFHPSLLADADDDKQVPVADYESGPIEAIRDREYQQHSSLWGNQYVAGGAGEGEQRLKPDGTVPNRQEIKTDAVLPAYCNPPNPCPYGHTSDDGCLDEGFENTAAFSREYQAAQDCMCDTEHMFDCPENNENGDSSNDGNDDGMAAAVGELTRSLQRQAYNNLANRMHEVDGEHKSLVAKKYSSPLERETYLERLRMKAHEAALNESPSKADDNPYLKGEKLPIAAKKGINVM